MKSLSDFPNRRRGIALPTAMGAIVLIGVIVSGVFYMSTGELRASTGGVAQERAFRAAEYGLNRAAGEWDNLAMGLMAPGTVTTKVYSGSGWIDTVHITKLGPYLYSVASIGRVNAGSNSARRVTGLTLRTSRLNFGFIGALTVRGRTRIGGTSWISGADAIPNSWTGCEPPAGMRPGVVVAADTLITWQGCPSLTCVEGSPKFLVSSAAADTSNYFDFGDDLQWADLTAMATRVYTGSPTMNSMGPALNADGTCNTSVGTNWGEPKNQPHACQGHLPIIHFKGEGNTVSLTGGRGQGILLVDGNLEVSGGFEFFGPVIVRGSIRTVGQSGSRITGGVMAADVTLDQTNILLGDATVRYSNCALERARQAAAVPRRVTERAWTEAF